MKNTIEIAGKEVYVDTYLSFWSAVENVWEQIMEYGNLKPEDFQEPVRSQEVENKVREVFKRKEQENEKF